MAYASRSGRARTSSTNPQAFAVCDRCGIWYNHVMLRFQFDWAGTSMRNTWMLVCPHCYDTPQEQLRAIVIPADPIPIIQPRIEPLLEDSTDVRVISGEDTIHPFVGIPIRGRTRRATQLNNTRVTQQVGEPPNGLNQTPGTDPNVPGPTNVPRKFTSNPETPSKVPETGQLE